MGERTGKITGINESNLRYSQVLGSIIDSTEKAYHPKLNGG